MDNRAQTIESLRHLASVAKAKIDAAIAEGKLSPRDELLYQHQVDGFHYGANGPETKGCSNQYVLKATWRRSGYLAEINEILKETEEFGAAVQSLQELHPELGAFRAFADVLDFTNRLTDTLLPDSDHDEAAVDNLIGGYLDKISGRPQRFVAELELTKLVMGIQRLEFNAIGFDKIVLRQVVAEDLQREFCAHNFSFGDVPPYVGSMLGDMAHPSAVLRLECTALDIDEMAGRIKQALVLLRLFQAAGVDIVDHRVINPPTASRSIGCLTTNYSGLERYLWALGSSRIDQENSAHFINFWQEMAPKIPEGLYKIGPVATSHVTIAYQRYCDALLQAGMVEARIASAVMGLEALLLTGGQDGEISFRLRTYAAQVLGILGHDPLDARKAVNLAYAIRSAYVHGSKLSDDNEKSIRKLNLSTSQFAEQIIDYLRVMIIVVLAIEKTKEAYTSLFQDALISEAKRNELIEACLRPRTLI